MAEEEQLRRERDLYLRLLDLGAQDQLEPFLDETLRLVTEVVGAHQGYLELSGEGANGSTPRWWAAHGFSATELEAVRAAISRGIVATALQTGKTIVTDSALHDERFEGKQSVQLGHIEAVICAPIGKAPPIGVLYLQRRIKPGAFLDADRARVETFARHLTPFADRLIERRLRSERADGVKALREKLRLEGVVGRSAALAAVLQEVALVAPLNVDVLLTGESGTGKTQIANAIHENSSRAGRPFVELNCAAIPDTLIESELFGAVRGGHDRADRDIPGKVAAAERGTLFLDEVGELSPAAQAKVLQLLQSRLYYPIGSAKPVRADIRLIAATNLDLAAAAADGRFREDLYYRLCVLPIRVPSLSERREDIPLLAAHFCAAACARHRLPRVTLSDELMRALQAAEWPGNIRQLAHAVEAAAIRAAGRGMSQVERGHLFPPSAPRRPGATASAGFAALVDACTDGGEMLTFQEATRRFHAELLRRAIEQSGWNIVETARKLELTRSYVYTLMKAFGIERPAGAGDDSDE